MAGTSQFYEVHAYTGTKSESQTKSNINFILAGTKGDSGIRCLDDGVRKVHMKDINLLNRPINLLQLP